jgi:acyl-coenzyme A thioesterase PaaI-like protein
VPATPSTSGHPAVAGRADELRALTDAVRRLIALTVTNTAPAAETAAVAAELDRLADRLEPYVPDPPLPRFPGMGDAGTTMVDNMPFDAVVGAFNPMALPVEVEVVGDHAVGRACFTTPYEGPPGCVQGGVIAAVFDIVLSAANHAKGVAGPTVSLTMRYRRPTLLHRDLVVEAEVAETDGRRTRAVGRLVQDGEVTVECEGTFAVLDRDAITALRAGRG